jgi:hypothetical protein
MICYRDMTFCKFYKKCESGKGCFRALTRDIKIKAHMAKLLIAQYVNKPECFEPKEAK